MKKWTFALICLAALSFSACDDEENFDLENTIYYDQENQTAPNLPAGDYEAAARFTSDELSGFVGRDLIEVSFFIAALPQDCTVKIYGPGTADTPGTLLYSAAVSNSLRAFSWNTHEIRRPLEITGSDLWLSISFTHSGTQQSIGCDPGPTHPSGDGDWLYQSSDNDWLNFRSRTGDSINWNIRGRVAQ